MDVSVVGLGRMGAGIARSLLRAGHRVTVFNRSAERAEALRPFGASVAPTIADACRAEAVCTMLADDAALENLAFGDAGVLASLSRGAVHVSLSTISVALSDRLADAHAKNGQGYVSAPVFGRPEAAEAGRVAVVAAGPDELIKKCKPLFEALGPTLFVAGDRPSMANVVKLSGNFLIATVLESLSEVVTFARKSGVDAAALLNFLTAGLFNAPVYKIYGDLIIQGKHEPAGFLLPLGLKDVRLVLQAAEAANVPMPVASVLRDRFITAMARGNQAKDWSVIASVAAEDAGLEEASRAAR
jgi:3-hydroxyisobutyrate dehydrogenase-like beta-hydroxyacid dehydrogenase